MRYRADITAGALKVPESRVIAGLLLREVSDKQWRKALYEENVLQTRSPKTAKRLSVMIRGRLSLVLPESSRPLGAEVWDSGEPDLGDSPSTGRARIRRKARANRLATSRSRSSAVIRLGSRIEVTGHLSFGGSARNDVRAATGRCLAGRCDYQ